jgi:hypothetical protein
MGLETFIWKEQSHVEMRPYYSCGRMEAIYVILLRRTRDTFSPLKKVVSLCTTRFNIPKLSILLARSVGHISYLKHRLFPYTALTGFLYDRCLTR